MKIIHLKSNLNYGKTKFEFFNVNHGIVRLTKNQDELFWEINILIFSERFSIGNEEEYCVLDRSSICLQWFHLWSLFGFNEIQWNSRAAKVEEHTRVEENIFLNKFIRSF